MLPNFLRGMPKKTLRHFFEKKLTQNLPLFLHKKSLTVISI